MEFEKIDWCGGGLKESGMEIKWQGPETRNSQPEVKIMDKCIRLNNFCIKNYFKGFKGLILAYDIKDEKLLLKASNTKYFKFWKRNNDKYYIYISAKRFIMSYCLNTDGDSTGYEYQWDDTEKILMVKNVKRSTYGV
jgi:hypothetical protein